jgi:NADPH:quinone reductase-like Zn-dependent oxidoreductase
MKIGVPVEIEEGEPRVAATPDTVKRMKALGADVAIDYGAEDFVEAVRRHTGGRGVEAVLDLVRAEEKLVSAALGPNQSKVFLDRVSQILTR